MARRRPTARKLVLVGWVAVACLGAGSAPAQVIAQAAVNGASFLNAALPNGKLAPGVLFTVFGSGMGPDSIPGGESIIQNHGFPLATELDGTSVRVTVGDVTADCPMIFRTNRQIAAILPSTIPPGSGSLTVSYNGQTSEPLPIQVIEHDFGIFSVTQSGYGQGVITDPFTNVADTIIASSNPDQMMDIWGTGLGAVGGDEAAGPLPGDMATLDVKVIVGGIPAQVIYRGRSGCCAGVDQIRFIVPDGVSGCYVPVRVIVDGLWSNDVTMAIAENGPYCSSPGGPTAADLWVAVQTGNLRQAVISISRSRLPDYADLPYARSDYAQASFRDNPLIDLLQNGLYPPSPRIGSCTITQSSYGLWGFVSISNFLGFDIGPVTMSGPPGTYDLIDGGAPDFPTGIQSLDFIPGYADDVLGVIRDGTVLGAGTYTFTSPGGSYEGFFPIPSSGPFSVALILPELLDWTNRDALSAVDRTQPLTVTWSNGVPGAWMNIAGTSIFGVGGYGPIGMTFSCWTDAAAGSFTVPPEILAAMPASVDTGAPVGSSLSLAQWIFEGRFMPSGIDVGRTVSSDSIQIPTTLH
jgi:uncharacterized protein (TIGR03437 family)